MASSAPAATAGLTLAALAGRDAVTLGLLPLGAAAFLGWVLVRSFAAAIPAQKWSLAAVLAVGVVLMLLARFVWRSPFFRSPGKRPDRTAGRRPGLAAPGEDRRAGVMPDVMTFRTGGGDGARDTAGFDATVAAPARVYDYWLGGKDNFAADRVAAEETIAAYPAIRSSARATRAFLVRAVSYLAGARGIGQFLDIGAGLPAAPNTHQVAQSIAPQSRVVYVDNDPMVLCHARALLASRPPGVTACVEADLRDPGAILAQAGEVLDFTRPAAILLLAVLDHLPGLDQARQILDQLVAAMAPGSFLVISHAGSDIDPAGMAEMTACLNEHLAEASYTGRPREVIARFFDGLDLVRPGVVKVTRWHPRSEIEAGRPACLWGGVARKPGRFRRG
jgi:O-methyltransferase involved in polyketide biosynthesis